MYDPLLLRSFVAVVESGGFTRAAQALHLTQSTVSQQLRRLEEEVGQRLLEREPGGVRPTQAGERLLGYARRLLQLGDEARAAMSGGDREEVVRLGVPEDLAGAALTPVLSAFARHRGGLRLEVTSGLSGALSAGYERGEFDVVLVKQRGAGGVRSWPERLAWIDSRDHPCLSLDPLPLAVFPVGGLYREEMFQALDAKQRRWRIAYSSGSLASLQAAVADGLGISLLPLRAVRAGHRVLEPRDGLPVMRPLRLALHHRTEASATVLALVDKLARRCEQLTAPD
ncbi:LysR family transcriptional regulator [Lysobacter sp. MMG2]|uniref:LysR family transcriptional regulator n=1 Tax=Lysobacter sp. MMG2 TaxID=2801338 RepID=UPI001C231A16|nr:LysR family transcriptional regulator [Lysobacter sp. MMG2]MBU8975171.1 LysR family transcriptional regulator [Lysobacter sp. MMG2]